MGPVIIDASLIRHCSVWGKIKLPHGQEEHPLGPKNLMKKREACRQMLPDQLVSQASTSYTDTFKGPEILSLVPTSVYPANRAPYPVHSPEGVAQRPPSKRHPPKAHSSSKQKAKHESKSTYKDLVSDAPQTWLEGQRQAEIPTYKDKQSAYLKQANLNHTFFVSPETMRTDLQFSHLRKTAYALDFPAPPIQDMTVPAVIPTLVKNITQYNGTEGTLWKDTFPSGKRGAMQKDDLERWKTTHKETHKWRDWKVFEDSYGSKRPFGPAHTEYSGFVGNMPHLICRVLNRQEQRVGQPGVRDRTQNEMIGRPSGFAEHHWNKVSKGRNMIPPF
ncbi:hypothetical protein BV898_11619 [Hypsibius exemplaris]|uniref:Uncharacterized protein n=1 Tax=Hypsibius exemplaris TaxID=2072580 RepID=A0A1W0WG16_HYPEX|nr:hypothetical protein BV898_11619 [Hypsibius exemplaris]